MYTIHLIISYHIDFTTTKKQKTTQLLKFLIKYVNNKPLGEYYK